MFRRRAYLPGLGLAILAALVGLAVAQVRGAVLEWDRNAEPYVTGYRAYMGTNSRSYAVMQDVGNALTATTPTLTPGATYFFAVTAYTAAGIESDYSAEVSYTVPYPPPAAPTGLTVVDLSVVIMRSITLSNWVPVSTVVIAETNAAAFYKLKISPAEALAPWLDASTYFPAQ